MDSQTQVLLLNAIGGGMLFAIIGILIFLLLREFWCWYFKINRIVSLLEDIEENTRVARTFPATPESAATESEVSRLEKALLGP